MQGHTTHNSAANAHAAVIAQGHTVNVYGSLPEGPPPPRDPWVELAAESNIWHHVQPDRSSEPLRQLVVDVVAALADVREGTDVPDDPWVRDEGVVHRFAECVDDLLGGGGLDLYPAEAALLVLTPFLYRTHYLQLAVTMRDAAGPSFTAFAESHDFLMARVRQSSEETAGTLTSWLFHRWLVQREEFAGPQQVRRLLADIGEPADAMGEVLDVRRVCRLLHGLRRGADVCNREFLDTLPADDAVRVRRGGLQRIRDQRLVLLLALAYGMSRDITALPQIVVEHVGIPDPVDVDQLHRTLSRSAWGGSRDLPVLRAECHHAAVIEGLREYVTRTDELLAAVRRTAHERITHPFPTLPARLSCDEVTPADDVVKGWAGFRLDERRVRDLLLGVQLYKDRDLALRELYQNALDACRYRRARTEYLDRTRAATYAYEGRISFDQATDEDGREYVECHDNGIGMGESELRGVFCKAGSRFVDQLDFKLERADWARADPPVEFHPNSRFGIGVLSYFMLADEMRVRTCRMDAKGELGPVLEVRVFGPGHLFRIVEVKERGDEADAGTRVRLYLREGERGAGWSCVDVLERLLGIAEFPTRVRHGGRTAEWAQGVFRAREAPEGEAFGINAHGDLVDWPDPPAGAQVIWCEHGGALLVDGLVVQPTERRGVLATRDGRLRGFVVNLFGPLAPDRLSADRANVLDDISGTLQEILGSAAHDVVRADAPLPTYEWIVHVSSTNGALGDLITVAAMSAGRTFHLDGVTFSLKQQGCFPADLSIVAETLMDRESRFWVTGYPPDVIVLWRLLAHRAEAVLEELAAVCPELAEVGEVRLALPSDMEVLATEADRHVLWSWRRVAITGTHMARLATATGASPEEVLERVFALGIHERNPDVVAAVASGGGPALTVLFNRTGSRVGPGYEVTVERVMDAVSALRVSAEDVVAAWRCVGAHVPDDVLMLYREAVDHPLFSRETEERMGYLPYTGPVPPGQIAAASVTLGISVSEVCDRFRRYGFQVDPGFLPDRPEEDLLRFLGEGPAGGPWLDRSEEVPPGHVIAVARDLGMELSIVCERLAGLGFKAPSCFPVDVRPDDLNLLYDDMNRDDPFLRPGRPIRYAHLFRVGPAGVRRAIERLEEYGFDIPLAIPRRLTVLDRVLLFNEDFWGGLTTEDVMPFARVLLMSRAIATAPEELVRLLDHYGVELSCRRMPDGMSREAASELIDGKDLVDLNDAAPRAPLARLIEDSRRIGATVVQTWHWYRALGLPVIDLPAALREAIPRIPRAS